jgi:hypothetical protein
MESATDRYGAGIYPDATRERPALVKREYDPTNVFRQYFNVPPA